MIRAHERLGATQTRDEDLGMLPEMRVFYFYVDEYCDEQISKRFAVVVYYLY